MRKELKAQRLAEAVPKKTAISITRMKEIKPDPMTLILGSMFIIGLLFIFPIGFFIDGSPLAAAPSIIIGLALEISLIRLYKKDYRGGVLGSASFNEKQAFLPKNIRELPNSRKLVATVPMGFNEDTNIEDIVYNNKNRVELCRATHVIEEHVVWVHGTMYLEQTIRETEYGLWRSAFGALVEKERYSESLSTLPMNILDEKIEVSG